MHKFILDALHRTRTFLRAPKWVCSEIKGCLLIVTHPLEFKSFHIFRFLENATWFGFSRFGLAGAGDFPGWRAGVRSGREPSGCVWLGVWGPSRSPANVCCGCRQSGESQVCLRGLSAGHLGQVSAAAQRQLLARAVRAVRLLQRAPGDHLLLPGQEALLQVRL